VLNVFGVEKSIQPSARSWVTTLVLIAVLKMLIAFPERVSVTLCNSLRQAIKVRLRISSMIEEAVMPFDWEEMTKRKVYDEVVCWDGFSMSVQAGQYNYSSPREDDVERYDLVEVGYPSEEEPLLMKWAELPSKPKETIYAYVPVEQVTIVIAKHGGMISGEVPPGVIPLRVEADTCSH
jgi:hypothetical protein